MNTVTIFLLYGIKIKTATISFDIGVCGFCYYFNKIFNKGYESDFMSKGYIKSTLQ